MLHIPGWMRERGQVLVLTALMLPIVIGGAGLAIDVGMIMHTRTELQKDADAMALAGARRLCGQALCESKAQADAVTWGTANGVTSSDTKSIEFGVDCDSGTSAYHDMITVRVTRYQKSFLARVLGFTGGDVSACATAKVGMPTGGPGLLPFGFHKYDPYPGMTNPDNVCYFYETDGNQRSNLWNSSCIIKIPTPAESWGPGNSGPIRLDEGGPLSNFDGGCNPGNSGSDEYEENILEGSECSYAVGDEVTPQPGSVVSGTCQGVNTKISGNTDSLADVFGSPDVDGVYRFVDMKSPRFGIIPIVTVSGTGASADITITGFITVYIEAACGGTPQCAGIPGNTACVVLRPMKSNIYMSGMKFVSGNTAAFTDENAFRAVKLVK